MYARSCWEGALDRLTGIARIVPLVVELVFVCPSLHLNTSRAEVIASALAFQAAYRISDSAIPIPRTGDLLESLHRSEMFREGDQKGFDTAFTHAILGEDWPSIVESGGPRTC